MHGNLWTAKEIEILRGDIENGVHSKVTALKLGRTAGAIYRKAVDCEFIGQPSEGQVAELRERWRLRLPAMRAAIREAVEQSA